jgi:hypothetical protein
MTDRRDNIDNNYRTTCSWLTETPEWLRWRRERSGLLWIKGHPGAGKSTIMKYAMRNIRKRDRDNVVAYFFDARSATELDKSAEGLYRSLLVQFLQQVPEEAIFESSCFKETSEEGADKKWSPPRLLELLHEAIHLLESDPITIFIDALDECSEEMLQDTVDHLGDLLQPCDSQLRICFASRYFPHITRRGAIDLRLEDQKGHHQDILLYIEGHLDSSNMNLSDCVRKVLLKKVRGSFIWAYLVLRLLKDEYRRGRVADLEARLEALPKRLEHLYQEILDTKKGDFRKETLICFTLVLLAPWSLNFGDLWWAIRLTCLPSGKDINVLEDEAKQMSEDDFGRAILDVSCGLVTASADNHGLHNVRFIHETTREFCREQTGLLSAGKEAKMHEVIKSLCWRTLQFYDGRDDFPRRRTPCVHIHFLDYAQGHVLGHANQAQGRGIDQSAFLREFVASKGLEMMTQPPDIKINYRGSDMEYRELIERLVAADYSFLIKDCQLLHELASAHNRIGLTSDTTYGPPILEALDHQLVSPAALMYLHTRRRKHESHIYKILKFLRRTACESLVEFYSNKPGIIRLYADVLFVLAEACTSVASFFIVSLTPSKLLEAKDFVKIRDVALGGFVNVFHFLLQRRLPPGPSTFSADDAMLWACKNGHTSILKVLLEGYQTDLHVETLTSSGLQPMVRAAYRGHVNAVELLLKLYKGSPQSLMTQADTIEYLAKVHHFPHSEEIIQLLVEWRLKHGIPGDFR